MSRKRQASTGHLAWLELSTLLRSIQGWLVLGYAAAFGAWRALVTGSQDVAQGSIPWALLALGGVPPQASFLLVLEWLTLPAAFVLFVGEPQTGRWREWGLFVAVRAPHRLSLWIGRVTARLGTAILYSAIVVGGMLLTVWIEGALQKPWIDADLAWVALGTLGLVLWYDTLFVVASSFLRNVTFSVVAVIGVGLVLMELASYSIIQSSLIAPALGAFLGSPFTGGHLGQFALVTAGAVVIGNWIAYLCFSREML